MNAGVRSMKLMVADQGAAGPQLNVAMSADRPQVIKEPIDGGWMGALFSSGHQIILIIQPNESACSLSKLFVRMRMTRRR